MASSPRASPSRETRQQLKGSLATLAPQFLPWQARYRCIFRKEMTIRLRRVLCQLLVGTRTANHQWLVYGLRALCASFFRVPPSAAFHLGLVSSPLPW